MVAMQNLLETRWKERDVVLGKRFLHATSEMNKRGILHSTVTVQEMYRIACDELVGSRHTIVSTIIDSLVTGAVKLNKDQLMGFAISSLEDRVKSIDAKFRERARVSGMLDSGMLKGSIELTSKIDGAIDELRVELICALEDYQSRNNGTLKDKIVHRLLNVPAVAWLVIAVVVSAALVSLVSDIVNIFRGS